MNYKVLSLLLLSGTAFANTKVQVNIQTDNAGIYKRTSSIRENARFILEKLQCKGNLDVYRDYTYENSRPNYKLAVISETACESSDKLLSGCASATLSLFSTDAQSKSLLESAEYIFAVTCESNQKWRLYHFYGRELIVTQNPRYTHPDRPLTHPVFDVQKFKTTSSTFERVSVEREAFGSFENQTPIEKR